MADNSSAEEFEVVEEKEETAFKGGKTILTSALKAISGLKLPVITVWLWVKTTSNSSATTAQAPVINVKPADSSEFASLAALYTECKVISGKILYYTEAPVANNVTLPVLIGYDPVNAVALSSETAGLSLSQHKLIVCPPGTSVKQSQPQAVTNDGIFRWSFSIPTGTQRSATNTSTFTGSWSDCEDSADLYGYVKAYIPATNSGSSTLVTYLGMECQFRSRM